MSAPSVKPSHAGRFREYLGLKKNEAITGGDIHRALKSKNKHARSMANFARMARRKWKALS